jgi:hypothetical protein
MPRRAAAVGGAHEAPMTGRARSFAAHQSLVARCNTPAIVLAFIIGACANDDFGRVKPGLVWDSIHDWIGRDAVRSEGLPVSVYPLTDEERRLRDLAYPLIEPPYDRNRWYSVINEYGIGRVFNSDWTYYNPTYYFTQLTWHWARSPASRYARLNGDIRNDVERIPQFFDTARRVVDTDHKREQSLAYVRGLTPEERLNATARVAENTLVIAWVQRSLACRAESYRFALERLVISVPSKDAIEIERSLTLLHQHIAANQLVAVPRITGLNALIAPCSQAVAVAGRPVTK